MWKSSKRQTQRITPALLEAQMGDPKAVKSAVSVNPTLQYSQAVARNVYTNKAVYMVLLL